MAKLEKPKEKKEEVEIKEEEEETTEPQFKSLPKRLEVYTINKIELEGKNIMNIKDNKKLDDRIVTRVILYYGNREEERITFKPSKWVKTTEKTELGFNFSENKKYQGISIKELPAVFLELLQLINKNGDVRIQTSITPFEKTEMVDKVLTTTEYITLNWQDVNTLSILE